MKKFFSPEPLIITTGGGSPGLFHDTKGNMKNAISLGSDVIRTNVSITKDEKIILFSNAIFQNREISERGVSSYTLEELKTICRTGADNQAGGKDNEDIHGLFPEFEESIAALKHQRFNLHLPEKNPGIVRQLCDIIRNLNAEDRMLVSSLTGSNLKEIRGTLPQTATAFSFSGIVGFYALYRTGLIFFKRKFIDDALIIHEMIGASFLANSGLIEEAKSRGIRVYVLNVMKEDQVKRLSEAGVNGFVTNYVSLVKRALPVPEEKS